MIKEVSKHKLAYLFLILGFGVFIAAFLGFWPNRNLQRISILGVTIFYFLWGITTHVKTDSFTKRVALEYGVVSTFGGFLLLMLTV
jgi:hypothetical protein